jgi:XapX domain-containing protein
MPPKRVLRNDGEAMKLHLVSLGAGVLVGIVYGLLGVRSPAPPVVALLGLLGILLGEQIVPVAKRLANGDRITLSWIKNSCRPHVFGQMPFNTSIGNAQKREPT